MSFKKIFLFDFSNGGRDGEPELERRGFIMTLRSKDQAKKVYEWSQEDDFLDFLGNIESDYGVHDFGTTGHGEIIGFSSYEIPLDQRDEVMNKWYKFISENDIECGPVIELDTTINDGSWPEYNLDHTPDSDR